MAAGLTALLAVAFAFALPSILDDNTGLDQNFSLLPFWCSKTVILHIPTTFITAIGWSVKAFDRAQVGMLPYMVPLFVSIVAGLPANHDVPQLLPAQFSEGWLVLGYLTSAAIASCLFSNLAASFRLRNAPGDRDAAVACVYWSLVAASVANALFPIPLLD